MGRKDWDQFRKFCAVVAVTVNLGEGRVGISVQPRDHQLVISVTPMSEYW